MSVTSKYGFTKFTQPEEFKSWLKKQSITRTIKTLQVHHMWLPDYSCWSKDDPLRRQYNTKNYHKSTNHWDDIAQQLSIFPDGSIVTGRSFNKTPIGIRGWNTNSVCVEIYGNFDRGVDEMTPAQKKAVIAVYGIMCKEFNIKPGYNTIRPHCWFTAGGNFLGDYNKIRSTKSCPGTNFMGFGNTKAAFQDNFYPLIKQYMNGSTGNIGVPGDTPNQPSNTLQGKYIVRFLQQCLNEDYKCDLDIDGSFGKLTQAQVKKHYLKKGSNGAHVNWLQKSLVNRGYKITVDGNFGNATLQAVKQYQTSNGLTVDGYVGVSTHKKIIEN